MGDFTSCVTSPSLRGSLPARYARPSQVAAPVPVAACLSRLLLMWPSRGCTGTDARGRLACIDSIYLVRKTALIRFVYRHAIVRDGK